MKLHRFYIEGMHNRYGVLELGQRLWINDEKLINQWLRVLRYSLGDKLILFNDEVEKIYKITKIEFPHSVLLEELTEVNKNLPKKHIYLFWSSLKKDKNDWVIQKATELGVKNFVPILSDRSEKTGVNVERSRKIIIEASEQCGRADIPEIREPISLEKALIEYASLPLVICEQAHESSADIPSSLDKLGILVGPEGGWSEQEIAIFKKKNFYHINLSSFTLRAETAAIVSVATILNQ